MSAVPYLALISPWRARLADTTRPSGGTCGERPHGVPDDGDPEGRPGVPKQEYTWVAAFAVVMLILIAIVITPLASVSYVIGALLSATAGYAGMTVATMANARTTEAAKDGPGKALPIAFRGGAVMGFSVAGLALLGLMITYLLFVEWLEDSASRSSPPTASAPPPSPSSPVGGGIYTKAADVGADLVGKVEAASPRTTPATRPPSPTTVTTSATLPVWVPTSSSRTPARSSPIARPPFRWLVDLPGRCREGIVELLMFPIAIAFIGMVASSIGSFLVNGGDSTDSKALSKALHLGTNVAMGLTILATIGIAFWMFGDIADATDGNPIGLAISVIGGLVVGWALGKTAEYYTSDHFGPVKKIAQQSETGPATTVLGGVSAGMVSVAASVGLILVGVLVAYWGGQFTLGDETSFAGIYGIAVAAIGMLATTGVVVSVDAYGPIADNAGGIAEMADLDPSVREVTDALDSLGNTTAAVAKGFAVGSAALTALALFKSFEYAVIEEGGSLSLNVGDVDVFIGLFIGAGLPFLFAALTIDAVGRAAQSMIEEVRRQFREIPGLREGAEGVNPDSARCVQISTEASLKEMIVPGALAVVVPLVVGFIDVDALGGLLAGALVTGFALAIFMANAGGAWDNAKKYIEAGNHGGKGSDPHKAAVVGDTVGDPFKDTSGPAMNILLKVMTIVSLVFASAFV